MMITESAPNAQLWAFEKISHELQALHQWVCWRYEQDDKGKLKKIPINAITGKNASVTNAADWHHFATAIAAYNSGRERGLCNGIGLVFCNAMSNYAGMDIDDAKGDARLLLAHRGVIDAFKPYGYCEASPSGQGVHIIVKGRIEGHRRFGVEAYSTGRFFTFTGHVLASNPIRECQSLLDGLQAELAPNDTVNTLLSSEPETADDDTIISRMFAAKNGANAASLFNGITANPDASAVDLALCNIIVWHTKGLYKYNGIWFSCRIPVRAWVT